MATLRTQALTKSYGGRTVVRGVNLDVASGEVVGLLGPNGAGKTTTFYMVVGLTSPDSGTVVLDGADVTSDPMYVRARKGIAYLPQEASIFRGLTVEQNILAILETLNLDANTRRTRLRDLLGERDSYWMEYDAGDEQCRSGSLADDLTDIYCELKYGLTLLDLQPDDPRSAFEGWRTGYRVHWGQHLLDAERHLYALQTSNRLGSAVS